MVNINVDFEKYIPKIDTFYGYFGMLKRHNFIKDVKIQEKDGIPKLVITRNNNYTPKDIF